MAEKNSEPSLPEEIPGQEISATTVQEAKSVWPELVGLTTEEAESKIKEDMSAAVIQVVPADSLVTFDYRTDRVRIFVDSTGKVDRAPRIG